MRTFFTTIAAITTFGCWSALMLAAGIYSQRLYAQRQQQIRIARLVASARRAEGTAQRAWADNSALRKEAIRKAQA